MATIKISDLHSPGSELFSDSESYMNELGDSELEMINGGRTSPLCRYIVRKAVNTVLNSPNYNFDRVVSLFYSFW